MAISDDRQRSMPSMADRDNAKPLAYKEAVLFTNPENPMFKGEVCMLLLLYSVYNTLHLHHSFKFDTN